MEARRRRLACATAERTWPSTTVTVSAGMRSDCFASSRAVRTSSRRKQLGATPDCLLPSSKSTVQPPVSLPPTSRAG